jgi:hypothetical protein
MRSNQLQPNPAVTEILWYSTSRRQHQLQTTAVRVGADYVSSWTAVRSLGISIDSDVSNRLHVSRIVSSCFAVLRQLRSIRCSMFDSAFQTLAVSLVLQRVDCSNAVLTGLPAFQHLRLQSVLMPLPDWYIAARHLAPSGPPPAEATWPSRLQAGCACLSISAIESCMEQKFDSIPYRPHRIHPHLHPIPAA